MKLRDFNKPPYLIEGCHLWLSIYYIRRLQFVPWAEPSEISLSIKL